MSNEESQNQNESKSEPSKSSESSKPSEAVEKSKVKRVGSRKEVWEGQAMKTKGGLQKQHLMINKRKKIISIKKYNAGKALLDRASKK